MATTTLEDKATIYQRPVELLQQLIRFDTTNPPGNEAESIAYINNFLIEAGIQPTILAKVPERPNLIARLEGRGEAPPLLVYAHIDVVTTENQIWKYPPFEGRIVDGYVWGRGALDNKNGVAMSLCALLRANAQGLTPPGDVLLAILCDEEQGGTYGSRYLIETHPGLFAGVRYAIAETGGFTFYLEGKKFYPIMVAEKQYCVIRAHITGAPQYATSTVPKDGTAARSGRVMIQLEKARLPTHVTPIVRQMIGTMSDHFPFPNNLILRQLLKPALTDRVLKAMGSRGETLYPMFHNTAAVIGIQGGEQVVATPAKVEILLGAGLLSGFQVEDFLNELHRIIGGDVELEVVHASGIGPEQPNLGLFETLCQILREADPEGIPMPIVLTAPTDACNFAQLGIQTYGFQPMILPPEVDVAKLAHAPDERIPVEALEFGTKAIYKVLQRFGN